MSFRFEDWMIHDYHQKGYTIFRGAIPDSLLTDLRREGDKARKIAHEMGPMVQRVQPVSKYAEQLNQKPFQDYCELPALKDAVKSLLGPDFSHGHITLMGILVEPRDRPWTVGWHRDAVVEVPPDAYDETLARKLTPIWNDIRIFNQVNCPLYAESCTWFVPGSHLRQHDLPGERESVHDRSLLGDVNNMSIEEAEIKCLEHCREFPRAVQMHLEAGDYMIYRQLAWHNGNYLPYHPRATLHDGAFYQGPKDDMGKGDWGQDKLDAIKRMNERKGAAVAV